MFQVVVSVIDTSGNLEVKHKVACFHVCGCYRSSNCHHPGDCARVTTSQLVVPVINVRYVAASIK